MPPIKANAIPPNRYLEDIGVGEVWHSDAIELNEADIVASEKPYDPQPFHVDAEAAAAAIRSRDREQLAHRGSRKAQLCPSLPQTGTGIVLSLVSGTNQRGETVMAMFTLARASAKHKPHSEGSRQ